MDVGKQEQKGYDKKSHLASLHVLVRDIKKEWPDENVCVDEETAEVVWERKPSIPEKKVDSVGGYLDRRKKDYPWI